MAGPGHAGSGRGTVVPCHPLGQSHCARLAGKGVRGATRLGWLQGMQHQPLSHAVVASPRRATRATRKDVSSVQVSHSIFLWHHISCWTVKHCAGEDTSQCAMDTLEGITSRLRARRAWIFLSAWKGKRCRPLGTNYSSCNLKHSPEYKQRSASLCFNWPFGRPVELAAER